MPRVKRGTTHTKKRKALLKQAKGYRWGRKNIPRLAKVAVKKAGAHAYAHRRTKKRSARSLWQIKINAAVREHGLTYSKFIAGLKIAKIELDRKVLSQIAEQYPKVFAEIVKVANNNIEKKGPSRESKATEGSQSSAAAKKPAAKK
ncbi:50S ribosomal protein L20 [bacterium]|nr:50S ribosomal protein L20 [bacterium]